MSVFSRSHRGQMSDSMLTAAFIILSGGLQDLLLLLHGLLVLRLASLSELHVPLASELELVHHRGGGSSGSRSLAKGIFLGHGLISSGFGERILLVTHKRSEKPLHLQSLARNLAQLHAVRIAYPSKIETVIKAA